MPIYEYQCQACGHKLETIQKFSDAPLTECPNCKQSALQKLISAAGFQLKGTGWYKTDYSSKGKQPKSEEGGDNSTAATETKSTETQSENKSSETKSSETKSGAASSGGSTSSNNSAEST